MPNDHNSKEAIQLLLDTGRAQSQDVVFVDEDHKPFLVHPNNYALTPIPEQPRERPLFKQGAYVADDVDSFCDLVKRHAVKDETELFFHEGRFLAVLNSHAPDKPGRGDLVVVLTLQHSAEWRAWMKAFERDISQTALAELMEDYIHTIADPPNIQETITALEVNRKVQCRSVIDLHNGSVQINYANDVDGQVGRKIGGKGSFEIPAGLRLVMPVYKNGAAHDFEVRLRYRLNDDHHIVMFRLAIKGLEEFMQRVEADVIATVSADTGLPVYRGRPTRPNADGDGDGSVLVQWDHTVSEFKNID